MIIISEDSVKIYHLLETAEVLFADFNSDKVLAFDHEDDFHVVIYSASNRNFILFSAKDHIQDTNAFPDLINCIQEYADSKIHPSLLEQAIKVTENTMHSKNNYRFYFDAH